MIGPEFLVGKLLVLAVAGAHLAAFVAPVCLRAIPVESDRILDHAGNIVLVFVIRPREPHQLARVLADQPGIVEHGLFLDVASQVIVAGQAGIRILEREK